MIHRASKINKSAVAANDGEVGHVRDIYFDDDSWAVRYFVVDTGNWLFGRRVLISPAAVKSSLPDSGAIAVDLSREQVKNSPSIDLQEPVSRRKETELHAYYGWPAYWTPGLTGMPPAGVPPTGLSAQPGAVRDQPESGEGSSPDDSANDHLRSLRQVLGYRIDAVDGEIGHVEDFLVNSETWVVEYLEIDTRNWWPGKKVLAFPAWIQRISWSERTVAVSKTRATIKGLPEYDPSVPLSGELDERLKAILQAEGESVGR